MTDTGYHRSTTGQTLYVKPLPLVDSPWSTGVIAGSENGTLGSYSFPGLDTSLGYEIFIQAGGSPANTDVSDGTIEPAEMAATSEPAQGAPPVSATMRDKIDWLYKAWRNKKTQTATDISIYADDTTTVDHKATLADDGTTATVGEMATGP